MAQASGRHKVVEIVSAGALTKEVLFNIESAGVVVWAEPSDGLYFMKVEHRPSTDFPWEQLLFERVSGVRKKTAVYRRQ